MQFKSYLYADLETLICQTCSFLRVESPFCVLYLANGLSLSLMLWCMFINNLLQRRNLLRVLRRFVVLSFVLVSVLIDREVVVDSMPVLDILEQVLGRSSNLRGDEA